MSSKSQIPLLKVIDLAFVTGALLTVAYYIIIQQEPMQGTMLHRYTTGHAVEYVVVFFFFWGVVDLLFRVCSFPLEFVALRQPTLPPRQGRESVDIAVALHAQIEATPKWFRQSRLGQRLTKALAYLREKESADGFNEYLHHLASQDEEKTHANFGLVRFICWVAPVLGILGTVIHFGSAFGGLSVDEIGDNLAKVVGEIGTAFNTTTIALAAAITMMFGLFVCERTEKGIVHAITHRVDLDLRNRFEVVDESLTPFVSAVETASRVTLRSMDSAVSNQLEIWSTAFQRLQEQSEHRLRSQAQIWEQALVSVQEKFEASDSAREEKLLKLLDELKAQRSDHKTHIEGLVSQAANLQTNFKQLVDALSGILQSEGALVKLQQGLADNLHTIRETQQLDQAMHGLTAAIHLLTARHDPDIKPKSRAA